MVILITIICWNTTPPKVTNYNNISTTTIVFGIFLPQNICRKKIPPIFVGPYNNFTNTICLQIRRLSVFSQHLPVVCFLRFDCWRPVWKMHLSQLRQETNFLHSNMGHGTESQKRPPTKLPVANK